MLAKSISQSQIEILKKCFNLLVFCRNNGRLMKNYELGTHNDKICADSLTGNTQNTPQFIQPICPNRPIIWNIFENSSHH